MISSSKIKNLKIIPDLNLRRKNFLGTKLLIAYVNFLPYIALDKEKKNPSGLDSKIIKTLKYRLNFTLEFVESVDGYWGSLNEDGETFNGMVGMLQRREVDVVTAGISITSLRANFIEFSRPYMMNEIFWIVSLNSASSAEAMYDTYVKPFHRGLWICIVVAIVLLSLFVLAIDRDGGEKVGRIAEILRLCFYIPTSIESDRWSMKLFILTAFFTFEVTFQSYVGVLVSYLTTQKPLKFSFFNNYDLLLSDYDVMIFSNASSADLLKNGRVGSVENRLWREKILANPDGLYEHLEHQKRLSLLASKKKLTLLASKSDLLMHELYPCNLIPIPDVLLREYAGFGFQKNSALADFFNRELMSMEEKGHLDVIKKDIFGEKLTQCKNEIEVKGVGWMKTAFAWLSLVLLAVLSSIFFLYELLKKTLNVIFREPSLFVP